MLSFKKASPTRSVEVVITNMPFEKTYKVATITTTFEEFKYGGNKGDPDYAITKLMSIKDNGSLYDFGDEKYSVNFIGNDNSLTLNNTDPTGCETVLPGMLVAMHHYQF